jgi:hypothetical protein
MLVLGFFVWCLGASPAGLFFVFSSLRAAWKVVILEVSLTRGTGPQSWWWSKLALDGVKTRACREAVQLIEVWRLSGLRKDEEPWKARRSCSAKK